MKILGGDWPQGRQAVLRRSLLGKAKALVLFRGAFAHDVIPFDRIESAELKGGERSSQVIAIKFKDGRAVVNAGVKMHRLAGVKVRHG